MRVLALTRYTSLGASSRLRLFQYVPYLQAEGIQIDVRPLLDDHYLRRLYAGQMPWVSVIRAYAGRIFRLLADRDYEVIWIEKELFPWLPAWLAQMILPRRARLIVDYDDAIFHNYDMHSSQLVRMLLGRKIDKVMRRADMVTAGNQYLADRARATECLQVEVLPTVIDLARYPVVQKLYRDCDAIVIGWIGSPSTAHYLKQVASVATRLQEKHAVKFLAIGSRPDQVKGSPFQAVQWAESNEVELLRSIDIGIMPLEDGPWERGKCGYKIIQYMACSLPVVASPVGVNQDIVIHGTNGFLAKTEDEWVNALTQLIGDAQLRRTMGRAGRGLVEETYCLQVQAPRLAGLIRRLRRTPCAG